MTEVGKDTGEVSDVASGIREAEMLEIDVPFLSAELKEELEKRLTEYEANYEKNIFERKDGIVPRVSATDYLIGGVISLGLTVYLLIAITM